MILSQQAQHVIRDTVREIFGDEAKVTLFGSRCLSKRKAVVEWVSNLEQNPLCAEQLEAYMSRFGRMQDTMADKLLPRWLLALAEAPGSQIETLNRAERLGVLSSTEKWLQARNLRNRLVHEYMTTHYSLLTTYQSMPEIAIRVTQISKCYHLYDTPRDRLKQFVMPRIRRAVGKSQKQYFREFWALKDISLEVKKGEIVGIVGRNGAGKSTLLQILCGTLTPSSGSVEIKGRVAALLELGAGFNVEFTGRENVYMNASVLGLSKAEIDARFDEIVEFADIGLFIDQPVKTYSSGMFVRLAFSIATSVDPDILVVDEALSVGDGDFSRKSFDRIMDLKSRGTTILFCSHALYQTEVFCDRVMWLDHGCCNMLASAHEVVSNYSAALLGAVEPTQTDKVLMTAESKYQLLPDVAISTPTKGQARFTSINVMMDGLSGNKLKGRGGESELRIRLAFVCDTMLPVPTVGVTLDYGSLLAVTCVSSQADQLSIKTTEDGHGVVEVIFPKLALRKGKYFVGVYLNCENALHFYDVSLGVAEIEMEDAYSEPGLVNMPHLWRCIESEFKATCSAGELDDNCVQVHGNCLMEVDSLDSLELLTNKGAFEAEEVELCRLLLNQGDRVLDIGANIGYFTLLFGGLVSTTGSVTAIEPDVKNYHLLQKNIATNKMLGLVNTHQIALGDQASSARLYRSDDNNGMHRLYASVCCTNDSTEVSVVAGDSLALAPLDLIKIDIEGYEPAALQGLSKTINKSPNLKILCEFSPLSQCEADFSPIDFMIEMREHGLRLITYGDVQWVETDINDVISELRKVSGTVVRDFITTLKGSGQSIPVKIIAQRAGQFLKEMGYGRPMLENVLFVAPGAWNKVSEILLDDVSASIATTADAYRHASSENPDSVSSPYVDLDFPLNVYAHALLLQEGRAEYLHYGLFKEGNADLSAAQQYSTELVLSQLPTPPCRILEVGSGLGTTISMLTSRGYSVHGITPDAKQIAHINRCFGAQVSVSCQALECFDDVPESYGVVLFQESGQYIDPLVIFNKALDLLEQSGSLIIVDEFALYRCEPGVEGLHLRADMLALAKRFGFEIQCDIDLSALAAPTLNYLLKVTGIHRQKLIDDLSLEPECMDKLDESNRLYQEKYAVGRYGYGLLHFRKKTQPKWRIRLLEEKQLPNFFDLFEQSFGHRMTASLWQWKYGSIDSRELCAWSEDKMVAHYGGMSRDIMFFGQPQTAVQIGDVIVSPNQRGVLTRSGPFFRLAATFLEQYIGFGKPYLIGFGFPNARAMKVAEKLGLYGEVGQLTEVSWALSNKKPHLFTRLHLLTEADAPLVDELWQAMRADLNASIVGVRNWDYVKRRYLSHPQQSYRVLIVKNRVGGKARGIVVISHSLAGCEITDVIAPLGEITLMTQHARRHAALLGSERLTCNITKNFAGYFRQAGGEERDIDIRIPTNIWSAGPALVDIKNHWWLMSGDMDFR